MTPDKKEAVVALAYTCDWIENLLRLNMRSAGTALAEFQHPAIGETIALGSNRMRLSAERLVGSPAA